jgi:hypothetical protein
MAKQKPAEDSVLVSAAKVVGKVAGTVASLTGASAPSTRVRAASRAGRLPPKNKSRLPRKQKKKLQAKAAKAEKLAA